MVEGGAVGKGRFALELVVEISGRHSEGARRRMEKEERARKKREEEEWERQQKALAVFGGSAGPRRPKPAPEGS